MEPCNSESSSTNSNIEEQDIFKNPNLVLDLSLSTRDSYHNSNSQLSLFHTNPSQNSESEGRVFSCTYCNRKFYSSQALGGHQNAHKRERIIARQGQRLGGAASFSHHDTTAHSYSNMAPLPLHGSFNRSLGIQVHSMIHKPSSSNGVPMYGHSGWARRPLDQQPAVGRLPADNHQVGPSSSGGAARFDGGRRVSMAVDGVGGLRLETISQLKSSSNQEDLKNLDLSLKL